MADAQALFWEKKLAENQHILDMIDAGQFMAADCDVIDAETIARIRISNALFATPPRGHRRGAAAAWWCVPVFPPHLRDNISLVY